MIAVPGARLFGCLERLTDINSMRPDYGGCPINTTQDSETKSYQQRPFYTAKKDDLGYRNVIILHIYQ